MTAADYNVKVTIRNNRILDAIREAGFKTQAEFARMFRLKTTVINEYVGLRKAPMNELTGTLKDTASELCMALGKLPEELWSEEQMSLQVKRNSSEITMTTAQIQALCVDREYGQLPDPNEEIEQYDMKQSLTKALQSLTPRRALMLQRYFMEGKTLEEIGKEFNVTRERVSQLIDVSLRTLRQPKRMEEYGYRDFIDNE